MLKIYQHFCVIQLQLPSNCLGYKNLRPKNKVLVQKRLRNSTLEVTGRGSSTQSTGDLAAVLWSSLTPSGQDPEVRYIKKTGTH